VKSRKHKSKKAPRREKRPRPVTIRGLVSEEFMRRMREKGVRVIRIQ